MTTWYRILIGSLLVAGLAGACGCGADSQYSTPRRLDRGMVVILPGIEGRSSLNSDIRRGLVMAGVSKALPIYSWGAPVPGVGLLINQTNVVGNRMAAENIAEYITNYQDERSGRPVYVVGHSGGGGVAVFVAEAMPPGRQLDGLILLSASISRGYDLTDALSHCRKGIVSFYNPNDPLLGVGTTVLGNVDGAHGPSAGKDGFSRPYPRLYQQRVHGRGTSAHTAATRPSFVATRVAPWVQAADWPPGAGGWLALHPSNGSQIGRAHV